MGGTVGLGQGHHVVEFGLEPTMARGRRGAALEAERQLKDKILQQLELRLIERIADLRTSFWARRIWNEIRNWNESAIDTASSFRP